MLSRLCLTSSFQEDAQGSDTASLLSEPAARGGRQRAGGISNEPPFSLSTATYRASRVPLSGSCSSARFSERPSGEEGRRTHLSAPSLVGKRLLRGALLSPGLPAWARGDPRPISGTPRRAANEASGPHAKRGAPGPRPGEAGQEAECGHVCWEGGGFRRASRVVFLLPYGGF